MSLNDKYYNNFWNTTMKLTDFDKKLFATKALEENYQVSFQVSSMNKNATQKMLQKVRSLANEIKEGKDFNKNPNNPAYMKLVFMEQALVSHYNDLLRQPQPRIVIENEEVEKSQVVLAAQDMVDTIQKMLEDVGQMQVKELPALVDSIESEIGVNEAQTYNDQVSAQLDAISGALKEAFAQMKAARDSITGQGGSFAAPAAGAEMAPDMGMDAGAEIDVDAGATADIAAPEPAAAEEPEDAGGAVGRAKR